MTVAISATFNLSGFEASRLKARVPAILRAYDKKLYPAFKEEISDKQFSWPNPTLRTGKAARKNAQLGKGKRIPKIAEAESPRDIVDSGDFKSSQRRRTTGSKGTEISYFWGNGKVQYAKLIFTGYKGKNGVVYPPRDWITPAFAKNPLEKFFREEWARLAARGI